MTPQELVQKNVFANVSSLVATLAAGAYLDVRVSHDHSAEEELRALFGSAAEMAASVYNWEEAAIEAGWERDKIAGRFSNAVDTYLPNVMTDTWQKLCEAVGLDPHQREVFEFWVVSPNLADKLEAHGEKVDRDFAGLVVWARTTTGQAIYADSVIEAIAREVSL